MQGCASVTVQRNGEGFLVRLDMPAPALLQSGLPCVPCHPPGHRCTDALRALISGGAPLEQKNAKGNTALAVAVHHRSLASARCRHM